MITTTRPGTTRLATTQLAKALAASPLWLRTNPTPEHIAQAIAEELLGDVEPQLGAYFGDYPDFALARRAKALELVDAIGLDTLNAAVDDALLAARGLSIQQPWASSITHLGKRVENRSRRTPYRGILLLHAAKKADEHLVAQVSATHPDVPMPRQAIVGTARLVGCHRATEDLQGATCCAPWGIPAHWHWEITNVQTLRQPVPYSGALNLWHLDADVLDALVDGKGRTA
ncbi:hypothetical protein ACIBBE_42855 [Streptomyces sp. NPDC051644]|uniref:hypothetical protein n=1 Tax=Streptomyces sp. NPDC051644 TaxID=3365666 RepID=UPI0037A9601F